MLATSPVLSGALIGLSIAAPIGPMGVLCISRTLNGGIKAGLSTGFGASTVNVLYCTIVLLGLNQAGPLLEKSRDGLSLAGAALMLVFAWRLWRCRRPATGRPPEGRTLLGNYVTAVLFNSVNPLGFVLLIGATAAVFGPRSPDLAETAWLLGGLFMGSAGWWLGLCSTTAAFRSRLRPGVITAINSAAAAMLIGFALFALARVCRGFV